MTHALQMNDLHKGEEMVDYPEVIPPIAMLSVTVRSIELHTRFAGKFESLRDFALSHKQLKSYHITLKGFRQKKKWVHGPGHARENKKQSRMQACKR